MFPSVHATRMLGLKFAPQLGGGFELALMVTLPVLVHILA
jgi:hypothetical protein